MMQCLAVILSIESEGERIMRRQLLFVCLMIALLGTGAHAVYFVNISDLSNPLTPPNPIKVAGTVTSVAPLLISDGTTTIEVAGISASLGDFIVVEGDWGDGVLTVAGGRAKTQVYLEAEFDPTGMIYVPGGTFTMGNTGGPSQPDELPSHSVTLSSFWMGEYEVTRGMYRKFMDDGGYSNPLWWSTDGWAWRLSNMDRTTPAYWGAEQYWSDQPSPFVQTDLHPVVGVTYYEAEAYCTWAGGYLPTEAQWEMAAQGAARAKGHIRDAGDEFAGRQTVPVGSYPDYPSTIGCFDMIGNVREWCRDWYQSNYYSTSQGTGGWYNPHGPSTGTARVLRGGAWDTGNMDARLTRRWSDDPNSIWSYNWLLTGFRLARPGNAPGSNMFSLTAEQGAQPGTWVFTLLNRSVNGVFPVSVDVQWPAGQAPANFSVKDLTSPPDWYPLNAGYPSWQLNDYGPTHRVTNGATLTGFVVKSAVMPSLFTIHVVDSQCWSQVDQDGVVQLVVR